MIKPEYFATGEIPADDDVHAEHVAEGRIPKTCRLGGPSLATLLPVIVARALTFCDVCPYTARDLCKGLPKPATHPFEGVTKSSLPEVDLNLTERLALRMKRDVARASVIDGVNKVLDTRRNPK